MIGIDTAFTAGPPVVWVRAGQVFACLAGPLSCAWRKGTATFIRSARCMRQPAAQYQRVVPCTGIRSNNFEGYTPLLAGPGTVRLDSRSAFAGSRP
jgi:hypothetical protein